MSVEFTYQCMLASGLHARPCSQMAEIAARFVAETTLTNRRNGRIANGKSVLSLISADVLHGDDCTVVLRGVDESPAAAALRSCLEQDLAAQEAALPTPASPSKVLPRALRLANIQAAFGLPLSSGFDEGALLFGGGVRLPTLGNTEAGEPELEERKLRDAILRLRSEFTHTAKGFSGPARGIVDAQMAILNDVTFAQTLSERIHQGSSAGDAIILTAHVFTETLARSESAYIRERAIDIQEVSRRLYAAVYGEAGVPTPSPLTGPTVLVAEDLGAQEMLQLDRAQLRGIVFGEGQATSHAVILARSLGIPAIAGVAEVKRLFAQRDAVFIDGKRGYVAGVSDATGRFYERECAVQSLRRDMLRHYATVTGLTSDGYRMEVAANISSPEEAEAALASGSDGIGLFRTEMLFIGRDAPPSEDEQFAAYARAVQAANGRTITLRTFDVGGDKPVAFLAAHDDPSSERSSILIYKEHTALLRSQLRAMMRASAIGKVRIMVPLISTQDEICWVRKQLELAQKELTAGHQAFDPEIELGIMVELPTAVPNLGNLADHADFFSIGTNDLAQYFFAADRTRSRFDLRAIVREPAFLRLLQEIATQAKFAKKWLGMCGEMAGDPQNLPLLVGLGLDEISLGGDVLNMKRRLSELSLPACVDLLEQALRCGSAAEVDALLTAFSARATPPLVDVSLVTPFSQSSTRDEVLRELADLLYVHNRASDADRLEDALWEREAKYSTDMGLGFALPHCKSGGIQHSSIALVRPEKPFLWAADSTVPIRGAIMLAMRDDEGLHMQVLSRLARKLMDEQFRERLLACTSGQDAVQLLTHEVGIT
jgi:multiphosphoryl transfer protein